MSFEQIFTRIDKILWRDDGSDNELDYAQQASWFLFLKYLDDIEAVQNEAAKLDGKKYDYILAKEYRWSSWAAPKGTDGKIDPQKAMTGEDLLNFVNEKLFPYLRGFRERAQKAESLEYKIGQIFSEIDNKIEDGYSIRKIVEQVDQLAFRSQKDRHEFSALYEDRLKRMGNAGRNGGQYYTPRPLIRAMLEVVDPKPGETLFDPACGSAGFLCESFEYIKRKNPKQTRAEAAFVQEKMFRGKEKKSLAYVLAVMNMILHGIEAPNVLRTNTLKENMADVQDKDKVDIILANPPFGGQEDPEVKQGFQIKTGETALLFMQYFIRHLKLGGRAAIVIKNTFLSSTGDAYAAIRKDLLETCNLHTIMNCPQGTFQGAGVGTVVLFFEKGKPTKKIWCYDLDPGRKMGKTNPLNDADLEDFLKLAKTKAESPKSWTIDVKDVDAETCDLSVRNPKAPEEVPLRSPAEIIAEIERLDEESAEILKKLKKLL